MRSLLIATLCFLLVTSDVSIFHARYLKSREEDILTSPTSNNGCEEADVSGNRIEDFESENNESEYSLTDRKKYKMLMPVLVNIGNLASCYSSNQFLEYFEEFKILRSLVRKGKGILKEDAENEFSEEIDLSQDSEVYGDMSQVRRPTSPTAHKSDVHKSDGPHVRCP